MPERTLAERLAHLKGPCHCHGAKTRGVGGSIHPSAHEWSDSCTCCRDNCLGTGETYLLPDCVRIAVESDHYLLLHGIGVEDVLERVSCAKAGCTGEHFELSAEAEDWWRAWWDISNGKAITVRPTILGRVAGSIVLADYAFGDTVLEMLCKAIEAELVSQRLL